MSIERVPLLANTLADELSAGAGRIIAKARKIPPEDRPEAMGEIFESWKTHRGKHVEDLIDAVFPVTPWSAELAYEAGRLVYNAFSDALSDPRVWDRRRSAGTIGDIIKTRMNKHVEAWAQDRGISRADEE